MNTREISEQVVKAVNDLTKKTQELNVLYKDFDETVKKFNEVLRK